MDLRIISLSPLILLAGCDPFYGVESGTTVKGPLDVQCISAALASVPETGHLTYQRSESHSTELLPKQRKVDTVMHVWAYGEHGTDVLQVNETPDGWEYRNARSRMGVAVPRDEMARFLPLMRKVNQAMQSRCGVPVSHLKAVPVGGTTEDDL